MLFPPLIPLFLRNAVSGFSASYFLQMGASYFLQMGAVSSQCRGGGREALLVHERHSLGWGVGWSSPEHSTRALGSRWTLWC